MIKPVPDRDSAEWWRYVSRHEFVVQACDGCGTLRFPARAYCHACRGRDRHWQPVTPTGRVASWIVGHQAFVPDLPTPYTVVMVRLTAAPDCVMVGNWTAEAEPVAGRLVRAEFTDLTDGEDRFTLINWGAM